MRIGAFEIIEPYPQLRDPHVITVVRPWVDVGSVATIVVNGLERHYGAKELGKLARPGTFLDFTRYRPTIRLVDEHREVTIPNSIINYAQPVEPPDFLFFHMLEPNALGEDYTDSVLEVFKFFSIKRYCRLGGMYDNVPHTRPLLVTGSTGGVPLKGDGGDLRIAQGTYEGPTSIMNLVTEGLPKLGSDVTTMNFMVHLPRYVQLEEDYAGAARLLEVLSCIYDLPPDLPPTERGRRQYNELSLAVERNPEIKAVVQQMEAQYDSQEAAREEQSDAAPLSPEVEQFLQEMDKQFGDTDESR